jgi:hypothetical protein
MGRVPKTKRKELSPTHRAKIWTLHEEGYNPSEIHARTGTPRSTINGVIARQILNPDPSFESRPRSGQPKKISQRGTRALVRRAISEPRTTLKALSTPSKSGKQLHFHTVVTVLKSFGKAKRRPRKKPFLTELHKKKRRIYCRAKKAIGRDNRKVCWSDEVTFKVGEDLETFWVTRGPGRDEEYASQNLRPTFKSRRTTVGVWSCYCGDEMGPLYMLPEGEHMTAKRYKYVLQRLFIPFYNEMRRKYGDKVVM